MRAMQASCAILLLLAACDGTDWESAGYQDGYAATYNTTCKIRGTIVHGQWDNAKYAAGYSRGANAASSEIGRNGCRKS